MEILFELVKQLSESLNLGTFLLVLTIIGLSSIILGTYFARNSGKRTGFWSIFKSSESKSEDHNKDVKNAVTHLQDLLIKFSEVEKSDNTSMKEQLERSLLLKNDVNAARDAVLKELENTKYIMKIKDEHNALVNQGINNFLEKISDHLTTISAQIDKVDELAKDMGSEARGDSKDVTKVLNDLSKDIALIERTIQTQISSIGVKLRQ